MWHWQANRRFPDMPISVSRSLYGARFSMPSSTSISHVPQRPDSHPKGTSSSRHVSLMGLWSLISTAREFVFIVAISKIPFYVPTIFLAMLWNIFFGSSRAYGVPSSLPSMISRRRGTLPKKSIFNSSASFFAPSIPKG